MKLVLKHVQIKIMSIKNVNYENPVPLRIDSDSGNYMRIKYQYIPPSIEGETTTARFVSRFEDEPNVGYVYHELKDGGRAKFKGEWVDNKESTTTQECVLLFRDDEVICVPINESILHLRKVENSQSDSGSD